VNKLIIPLRWTKFRIMIKAMARFHNSPLLQAIISLC